MTALAPGDDRHPVARGRDLRRPRPRPGVVGGGVVERRRLERPGSVVVVRGSHVVSAAVGDREGQVALAEVGHLQRRVGGARGQRRRRCERPRRARAVDHVQGASVDEADQQHAAVAGGDHRLRRRTAQLSVHLDRRLEHAARQPRDEHVGRAAD